MGSDRLEGDGLGEPVGGGHPRGGIAEVRGLISVEADRLDDALEEGDGGAQCRNFGARDSAAHVYAASQVVLTSRRMGTPGAISE
jgi:hypothetical protein